MNILHIGCIKNNPFNGVCVVVPKHIRAQLREANVGLINIVDTSIPAVPYQHMYSRDIKYNHLNTIGFPYVQPDIVVFHEVYHIEYCRIANQLNKLGIPYIILPHGSLTDEAQKKKRVKKWLANILCFDSFIKNASAIQCLSQNELNKTRYKNAFVCSNGVDVPDIKKTFFRREGWRLLYIGRLESHIKGFDLLLDSIVSLHNRFTAEHIELDIYGPDYNGRYANLEAMIVQRNLSDIVHLHPAITGKEKETAYLDADCFIQTSRTEGMPLGILEALSYGLPCIVTEGTSLGKLVMDNNLGWVAETNVESITKAISLAFDEKALSIQKSKNAVRVINEQFSWTIIAKETVNKYAKTIESYQKRGKQK